MSIESVASLLLRTPASVRSTAVAAPAATATTTTSGASFADLLASASTTDATDAADATALVGTPTPDGGCGCDRLASTASTSAPASVATTATRIERPTPSTVLPGDLLLLAGDDDTDGHLGLALDAFRMIAGVDGVFREIPIDWDLVVGARRR